MALNDAQLVILRTELTDDPQALGYAGKSHPETAALLNTIGLSGEVIQKESVPTKEARTKIVYSEWNALAQGDRDMAVMIFGNGESTIDLNDADLTNQILSLFRSPDPPDQGSPLTRAALVAFASRDASRAEILFGVNTVVAAADVAEAR